MDMASSKWTDVVSGVPHMSVLEPLLFVVYFNDLPVKTVNVTKHFAEVSKIISVIKEKLDFVKLQNGLFAVWEWYITWGTK